MAANHPEFRKTFYAVSSEVSRKKRLFGYTAIGVYSCAMIALLAGWATERYLKSEEKRQMQSIAIDFCDKPDES